MTSYLKMVVPVAAVAALLASPVLAKTNHHHPAPSQTAVPADVHASTARPAPHAFVTPYGAELPQQPHTSAVNPDFQVPGKY
jgi:hypothetical protein